jgi:hypothetical protein
VPEQPEIVPETRPDPPSQPPPGSSPRPAFSPPSSAGPEQPTPLIDRAEIDAAIAGLDRASRNFAETLAALERLREIDPAAAIVDEDPDMAFDRRMQEAEVEARAYLNRAKARADALVTSMVSTIEQQANEVRTEAESAIRSRWQQVEAEADRHLEEARRVAAGMVAERQERLAELSDGISGRADSLLGGMTDADEVRRQFDSFVAALSRTAALIAAEASPQSADPVAEIEGRRSERGPGTLAA